MICADVYLQSTMQLNGAQRYELLRAAALGAALPPEARSGLTILLHRGMWAWVRALSQVPCQSAFVAVSTVGLPPPDDTSERRAIIHLLAAMVMAAPERRETA